MSLQTYPDDQRINIASSRARTAWRVLLACFRSSDGRYLQERIPPQEGDHPAAYLWGYSAALAAAVALARMEPRDRGLLADLERMLAGLEDYWAPERAPAAYRTTARGVSEDERFYDDNEWVALALLEAFRLTNSQALLQRSMMLFEFVKSGSGPEMGGGVYWKEDSRESKNTCSSGPAVVLALELWRATGDRTYLSWARPVYGWLRRYLQSPQGIYWDRMERDGRIEKTAWTYNTGIMIQAAALWYRAEGDPRELAEAQRLARASLAYFAPEKWRGAPAFPPTPWFHSILFHGYQGLYELDGNPEYLGALALALDRAWTYARDERGLINRDWTGRTPLERELIQLLDIAPVVEIWARLSRIGLEWLPNGSEA